jgi:hypothetical protein
MLGYKPHIAPVGRNLNDAGQHSALQTYCTGEPAGRLRFSDLQKEGRELLEFDPRGEIVEIYSGGDIILEIVPFPDE